MQNCADANQLWNEGCNYYNGNNGVSQDYAKAFKLFEKAADLGSSAAESMLGYMYQNGQGFEKDEKTAFDWYLKSAGHGNAWGQANTGWCLKNGVGIETDYKRALDYLQASAMQNPHPNFADSVLGEMYEGGLGVEKNVVKALEYYVSAASSHNEYSMSRLDYYSNVDVLREAICGLAFIPFEEIEKNAQNGQNIFQAIMALCHKEGIGVKVDFTKAWTYLNMNDQWPFCSLKHLLRGQMFDGGQGVDVNKPAAFEHFLFALPDKQAIAWLEDYFSNEPSSDDYEERIRYAYRMNQYCSRLERHDPNRTMALYNKAFSIGKEEREKGHNETESVRIEGTPYLSTPQNIICNSVMGIAHLYESGLLSGIPDYEKAIEYYQLAREFDHGWSAYDLARLYRESGRKKEEVLLYIDEIQKRKEDKGAVCFVPGAEERMIKTLQLLVNRNELDKAISLYNKFQELNSACDSCAFGNDGLENYDAAEKSLSKFIREL